MVKPPLSYSELDTTIGPWATHHGVHVYVRSQDEEVRVAAIVDDAGDTYHITVTPSEGGVAVDTTLSQRAAGRVLSFRERREFVFRPVVPQGELRGALDETFNHVSSWIIRAGHSRTAA
jgi:hypothetical protein